MSSNSSSRWCPTKEQVMILEELYRDGMRNPSASQIQQITARLSCYGKIQGKNVFYWFQNHKARHRQKLRRSFSLLFNNHLLNHYHQPLFVSNSNSYYHLLSNHHHDYPLTLSLINNNAAASSYHQLLPFYNNYSLFPSQYVCKMEENADVGVVQLDHPTTTYTPPLQTLQLFPLKPEGLKDHTHHKHNQ